MVLSGDKVRGGSTRAQEAMEGMRQPRSGRTQLRSTGLTTYRLPEWELRYKSGIKQPELEPLIISGRAKDNNKNIR